jgi:carbamoyl-phosphate synthase large subunit
MALKTFKIFQLSVGSLLGQVMLDVLENRRAHVEVVGLNSIAEAPGNFRCDRVYLAPETADQQAYLTRFKEILALEQPDLILPGRDEDVCFLSAFKAQNALWTKAIPSGNAKLAEKIIDKYDTFLWSQQQGLPFADSLLYRGNDPAALEPFMQRAGSVILAKPRKGFGSKGVFFMQSMADIEKMATANGELLLQEYLGDPGFLAPYFKAYSQGMPLFFQVPETQQFAAQGLIGPDGKIGDVFCSQSTMVLGRTERFCKYTSSALEQLFFHYARALRDGGWRGSVNVQAKPHATTGQWKAFELNLRMSGGTACRLELGFDEMHNLIQAFYPTVDFPVLTQASVDVVFPSFKNQCLHRDWVLTLETEKIFTP